MFDFLYGLFEFVDNWRLYTCVVLGFILAAVIFCSVANETLALILSIPVALAGIVIGVIWHYRSTKEKSGE